VVSPLQAPLRRPRLQVVLSQTVNTRTACILIVFAGFLMDCFLGTFPLTEENTSSKWPRTRSWLTWSLYPFPYGS